MQDNTCVTAYVLQETHLFIIVFNSLFDVVDRKIGATVNIQGLVSVSKYPLYNSIQFIALLSHHNAFYSYCLSRICFTTLLMLFAVFCGMWRRAFWWNYIDISKNYFALSVFYPDDANSKNIWNIYWIIPDLTESVIIKHRCPYSLILVRCRSHFDWHQIESSKDFPSLFKDFMHFDIWGYLSGVHKSLGI